MSSRCGVVEPIARAASADALRHASKSLGKCGGKNSSSAVYKTSVFGGCPMLKRFLDDECGATAIEYGLIAGLIAVVIITAVTSIGTSLNAKFTSISNSLT